jgi:hypothetical protein
MYWLVHNVVKIIILFGYSITQLKTKRLWTAEGGYFG